MPVQAIGEVGERAHRRDLEIQVADASVTPPGGPGDVAMATRPNDTRINSSTPAITTAHNDSHVRAPEAEIPGAPFGTYLKNFDGTKYIVNKGRYSIDTEHVDNYVLIDSRCYEDLIKGRVKGCPITPVNQTADSMNGIVEDFSPTTADSMGYAIDAKRLKTF